eukprot:gnl/TRDRNA2_/TRDRNA2_194261_c0_seq1.p1 gnl/TRDRNA2_/TRDRNA2_194261_c0~~gnl/TRDRNA2_/TRDRNA2_194261_c0_seq1.p1  ORF type:complete len:298 (-),score=45.82 gnl/TRDRNA2_/TRDRNA2_194261_c0_seq1:325-1218(-)
MPGGAHGQTVYDVELRQLFKVYCRSPDGVIHPHDFDHIRQVVDEVINERASEPPTSHLLQQLVLVRQLSAPSFPQPRKSSKATVSLPPRKRTPLPPNPIAWMKGPAMSRSSSSSGSSVSSGHSTRGRLVFGGEAGPASLQVSSVEDPLRDPCLDASLAALRDSEFYDVDINGDQVIDWDEFRMWQLGLVESRAKSTPIEKRNLAGVVRELGCRLGLQDRGIQAGVLTKATSSEATPSRRVLIAQQQPQPAQQVSAAAITLDADLQKAMEAISGAHPAAVGIWPLLVKSARLEPRTGT